MRLHNNCLNLAVDGVVGHVAMCDHALYRKVMKYGWIAMSCRKLGTIFWGTDYGWPMKPFFNDISNFWANWEDRSNKILGKYLGYFRLYYQHPFWYSEYQFSSISWVFYKKVCFSDLAQICIVHPKYHIGSKHLGYSHQTSVVGILRWTPFFRRRSYGRMIPQTYVVAYTTFFST